MNKKAFTGEEMLDELSNYIFISKYAKYNSKLKRRETWEECIKRVKEMHLKHYKDKLSPDDVIEVLEAFKFVEEKYVVPSMRSLQFGGKAIEASHSRLYNCAVRHIDSIRSFAECMFLLMSGCGVGFGLTKRFVDRLPDLVGPKDKTGTVVTYLVEDSLEGWSDSIEALLNCYFKNTAYSGRKIIFDYSKIRPKGAPLKTAGGKAPGYKGLKSAHIKIKELLDYIIEHNHQSRMFPINAYDILMHCADAVLSGGIRRSACIAIIDKTDTAMINAKINFKVSRYYGFEKNSKGNHEGFVYVDGKRYEVELNEYAYNQLREQKTIFWKEIEPQRGRSNNSVLLIRGETTFEEFKDIYEKTKVWGEPGFIWADYDDQLVNPCVEISFRPILDGVCGVQFCNLTSMNGRKITSREIFKKCVKYATIIGTLQAGYTNFKYLSNAAKQLTDNEALLGVSICGVFDNPDVLLNPEILREGAKYAIEVNKEWAEKLKINPAARVTAIKPEGTTSLIFGSGSGAHPHHAHKYFRRVQNNKLDNPYQFFKITNDHMCEESVWSTNKTDDITTWPLCAPKNAMVNKDLTALSHLDYIKLIQENWVRPGSQTTANKHDKLEHNVSCTVTVADNEWDSVAEYLYNNRHMFCAVSFISQVGDKAYPQAPREEVTTPEDEERWNNLIQKYEPVNFTLLEEETDDTKIMETAACAGGKCEL